MKYIFFGILISLISKVSFTQSTVVNIYMNSTSGQDAVVTNATPIQNYGGAGQFNVYWSGSIYRTYLQADFSSIPTNAIVTNAKLKLTCTTNDFSAAQSIQAWRVLNSWTEMSITWDTQPTTTSSGVATFTTPASTGLHTLTSTTPNHFIAQVQNMINYPALNFGWCLRMQTESGSTRGLIYKSREGSLTVPTSKPYIEVTYIMPITVGGTVTHCAEGFDNGLISGITYTGGTGTYTTYQWYKYTMGTVTSAGPSSAFANINNVNLEDGLYLLRVTDSGGNIGYKYFLVGEENTTTTVEFSNTNTANSALFNDDAFIQDGTSANTPGAANSSFQASRALSATITSLLKYRVDFDPLLTYHTANLYLYGITNGHIATNGGSGIRNQTTLSRATAQWHENLVTWNTQPGNNTPNASIGGSAPGTTTVASSTIDVLAFINYWKANPSQNFGWRFDMNTSTPVPQQMRYGSYDNTTANLRPKLVLTYSLPKSNFIYATPKKKLEGGYHLVPTDDKLRFEFYEEYTLSGNLYYTIKNETNQAVTIIGGTVTENFGDNRVDLNVASLLPDVYVLEIKNDKNEVWYLRFKVQ